MFAEAHEREFDVVLNVFDMESAAALLAARERRDHRPGQALNQFANPGRRRALPAMHGEECFGHGNRDLAGLKRHHRTIAADDLEVGEESGRLSARCGFDGGRGPLGHQRLLPGALSNSLHTILLVVMAMSA